MACPCLFVQFVKVPIRSDVPLSVPLRYKLETEPEPAVRHTCWYKLGLRIALVPESIDPIVNGTSLGLVMSDVPVPVVVETVPTPRIVALV